VACVVVQPGHNGRVTRTQPLPSRLIGLTDRIPRKLSDLAGPSDGWVSLPLRLAWTGLSDFDVSDDKERLTLYRTLLDCGQRSDMTKYLNADLLCRDWPRIRRLTARRVIAVWERQLPELGETG
jgi:hypothetical protein